MNEANKTQVGGSHYLKLPIQCWDYITANGLGFLEGSIIKYVTRWKDKGGIEDLKKARHYLDKLIETVELGPHGQPEPDGGKVAKQPPVIPRVGAETSRRTGSEQP